jgi:cytochrome c biogenesis protein CcmG/thiol:disulfide interchange protein DsbE
MSEASPKEPAAAGKGPRFRPVLLLPLALFAALAAIFFVSLRSGIDPEAIPSALVGKPAPEFDLPALPGATVPGLKRADLAGKLTLVNVFASWCGPCRLEHPQLQALAGDSRIRLVGINYKDQPANALRFLGDVGNPYAAIGVDEKGRAAIDWGVYGVPETFIVGPDGTILCKFIGPITEDALNRVVRPEIDKALAGK